MPELPEVETIRKALAPRITGRRFVGVDIIWPKVVHTPPVEEFRERLIGQEIRDIRRRGKYFLIDLSGEGVLVLHLKMTGVLLLEPPAQKPAKHTNAVFRFEGEALHFIDQRKFGSLWLVGDEGQVVGKLGPEPLEDAFTPGILRRILSRHTVPVKALLCDQNALAGIGNMYADEALFAAGIHPLRKSRELTQKETARLHGAIIEVLERGLCHNGASVSTYCLPDGTRGMAHTQFRVAHRRGERCLVCDTPIIRISVRGRGTYYCPVCQRK